MPACSVGPTMLRLGLLLLLMSVETLQQLENDCPNPWILNADSCYKFVSSADMTYQEAAIYCLQNYATLLRVNSEAEHRFIQDWLNRQDSERRDWFTSGYRDKNNKLLWEADGSEITTDYFPSTADKDNKYQDPYLKIESNQIVYRYIKGVQNEYKWAWSRLMIVSPFICEISKQDTWKLYQQARDFSYGTDVTDPNQWEMGPNITFQSRNTVFFESNKVMTTVILDCQALGNPRPDYRWYRRSASQSAKELITSSPSSPFTVTNGRLTITNPDSTQDASMYTCEASNKFGTVISNPIEISYGYIGEFSNVEPSAITATMYMGKEITCQPPGHNTDLSYKWFKKTVFNFIRPETNAQYFLSKNGNFYISEVQDADADMYYCAIFMAPKSGQVLANTQAPSRTSLKIQLNIAGENANTYGPDIQDKFPQVFPSAPMVGSQVDIECLAYGRLPLYYSWVREDAPMSPDVIFKDYSRVLTIPRARLEDTGAYRCVVKGERTTANKTVFLTLQAPPSFPYPLQNQHTDAGSKLTWICSAIGVPKPTYTWYRNGEVLTSRPADGLTVNKNILTIDSVDAAKHSGMYQCEASNSHGVNRSSAQLRALSFKPTFANSPVPSSKSAADGGNITISCRPEAAPRATIKWTKNGQEVGKVLLNGDLQLTFLTKNDAGTYVCVAENSLGQASSNCTLVVQAGAVFSEVPSNLNIEQNETASLPCKASFDRTKTDVIYSWKFNDHLIDFSGADSDDFTHYAMRYAQTQDSGLLYIISAQFRNEGEYTCLVSSVTGSIQAKAYVTVKGAPGEPGGIHARITANQDTPFGHVEIWWQPGELHFYEIHKYAIEYQTNFDDVYGHQWTMLALDIPELDTHIQTYPMWRVYQVTDGLSPGTEYRFRVRAGNNQVGYGPPSRNPSVWYKMPSAAPVYAPSNVRGGGGSVRALHIAWDPLPRSLWGATRIQYSLHFRLNSSSVINDGKWQSIHNLTSTVYNTVVEENMYYMPYEVKVQPENEIGKGPNSTIVVVYSAEAMPSNVAPTFLQASAINGTAGIVEWEPIPNTREASKGTVLAYQVNYWLEGDTKCIGKYEDTARFVRFYGGVTSGLIVGMEYSLDYCLNLQFLNHAGMGPKTDNYYIGMNFAPPSRYPEYVQVASHGNESVRLLWRGVSVVWGEEPLIGYKAWWWDSREDIRTANITTFGKTSTGVIHGVHRNVVYKLRMMGYSIGGDGKKSQDVYFTLGGEVPIDPVTTVIMNSAPVQPVLSFMVLIYALAVTCLLLDQVC